MDTSFLSPYETCELPFATTTSLGPNTLGDFYCEGFLRSLQITGIGIVIHPIVTVDGPYTTMYSVAHFYDDIVRRLLLDFHNDAACPEEVKKFQACATIFKPCNFIDTGLYENVPFCKEACLAMRSCTANSCTDNPAYDSTNVTHCLPMLDTVESASASSLAAAASLAWLF